LAEQIRIEIRARDEFWRRAFRVEWEHNFPDRKLVDSSGDFYLVEPDWLGDLERVAAQTFCSIQRAPENPRRREWLSSIIARRDRN
jgi:hypothetical protein